jgi:non-homologous end joining protein Ku
MAPRPYWKGYLKLSLISCPIALYAAIEASERVSFRQVNRATGNRLRQQLVDSVTGTVVESNEKGRGYEVGENQFLVVEDEELEEAREEARSRPYTVAPAASVPGREAEQLAPRRGASKEEMRRSTPAAQVIPPPRPRIENKHTIEIERFVPRGQIDARFHHTPYYIAPRDLVGQEAFAVLRDAMKTVDVVGMGRVVLSNRERPIMLEPMGLGLRGITLRYAHEVRSDAEYFADIPEMPLPKEMLSLAERIVAIKLENFDRAYLEDRYRTVLVSMLKEKNAQRPPRPKPATPSQRQVIDLMEVLKKSLKAERAGAPMQRPRRVAAASSKAGEAKRSKGVRERE